MSVKSTKVPVHQLQIGMYVSDLDRPWCQTPFPIQGFYVRSNDDIRSLTSFCKHVFVDQALDRSQFDYNELGVSTPLRSGTSGEKTAEKRLLKLPPIKIKDPQYYDSSIPLKKEVDAAAKVLSKIQAAIEDVLSKVKAREKVSFAELDAASEGMVDSVIRNPDALVWLHRVRQQDEHSYHHAINAAVWALVFGRHLGLTTDVLKNLSTGVLLSGIGKSKLDPALLHGDGSLSSAQFEQYKAFVDLGVEILESCGRVSHQVITIVQHHKERHNGTGYPQGLTGDKIPLLAKIAGIVDAYQSLIEPRMGAEPMTPSQAVSHLYEARNIEFQEDLVERFIQAIGVYPTGSIVQLTTEEVGIVVSHNPKRRLWPKVMVVLDENKRPLKSGKVVDLLTYNESRKEQDTVHISSGLPFGTYDVDPSQYQVTGATSRWSVKHLMG
ncbi:MAG: DUF3391 domain-containing protein [Hahellaceae bacterium]|nr:DUF3391 domain-containing protein [Hahellaceae bacterium]MCP5211796.1 DUF3391 domain-containing protein [Hahellaceae bacterium]